MKTPYPAPSGFTDATGRPIAGGSWFRLRQWPYRGEADEPGAQLASCYIWRLEHSADGQYILVAYGEDKRLPLDEDLSREIVAFQPSDEVLLHEYPLEWGRWLEAGIGVYVTSGFRRASLQSQWKNQSWGGTYEPDSFINGYPRKEIKEWLMVLLYCHLHPHSSKKLHDAGGEVAVKAATERFVRAMERREAAGLSSFPRRGRER